MEKRVLVISNTNSVESHSNTLANFKRAIPQNYLDQHKSWSVAVASAGLHLRLKNPIVPQNESIPSLIQINKADFNKAIIRYGSNLDMSKLPLHIFSDHHKIFIDGSKSYTASELVNQIKRKAQKWTLTGISQVRKTLVLHDHSQTPLLV